MAKEIQVTCKFCKNKVDKSIAISDGKTRYFCSKECEKHQLNKDTYKAKKVKSDGIPNDRRLLTDYMLLVYTRESWDKSKINWEMLMKQLNNIMSDHKEWTYNQIRYVLKYMYEIVKINILGQESNGSILSLVPYYFNEAKDFATKTQEIKKSVANFEFNDDVIVIKKSSNNINRCFKEIDMENL